MSANIEKQYEIAKERYSELGIDTDKAIEKLNVIPLSMHCWQGDDVGGFEVPDASLSGGGIQATGNYPGKARNAGELRQDMEKALSLLPGEYRVNLHSIYAETDGQRVERDQLGPEHFSKWASWAKEKGLGIDFNPSLFSHPKADDGFTLSNADEGIRKFWIEHVNASRRIAASIGSELGKPVVNNIWIPDGYKDIPVDRLAPRKRLMDSLDKILGEKFDSKHLVDSVECKLFGIGSESYVVGSHEFYMGYAMKNNIALCLDMGHFHPTEVVSDKLSSVLLFVDEVLLHVSRGVRWDSDHVVILGDELLALSKELVAGDLLDRVHIGLDFFDASINRVAAWVIGLRAMRKALLAALLTPFDTLKEMELEGDLTARLATLETLKTLPVGAVWDYICETKSIPLDTNWLQEVKGYEKEVLATR